jgi:hypothetical protein
MLAPTSIATFLLAKRLVRHEWTAVAAAILTVISTPITAKSLEITPFGLTALFATLGLYLAVVLVETPSSQPRPGLGVLCGLTWAAAGAAHALCFPMAIATLGVLGAAPEPGGTFELPLGRRALAGTLRGLRVRLAPVFVGFVAGTLPVAFLNHLRFNAYNPISYGPIPWTGLLNREILKMTLVDQLRYSALPVAFAGVVALALYLARRRGVVQLGIALAGVAIAGLEPHLREHMVRYVAVAWAYLVDMTTVDMGPVYPRAADGVGRLFVGWVIKSTLQCTPILLFAPLALRRAGARLWALVTILVPCAALYASFVMRANLAYPDALGWPWVYIRYIFAALPGLIVASLVVIEQLEPKLPDVLVAVFVGSVLTVSYAMTRDDALLVKRVALLVLPLAVGAAALGTTLLAARQPRGRASRWACGLAAVAVGLGIASSLGHDLRANIDGKRGCDDVVNNLRNVVPERFALIGTLGQFDVLLTSTATHDVQYADVLRLNDSKDVRPLLDYWWAERRPIYIMWGGPWSPWPDVVFKPVSMPGLFLVERIPSASRE